MFGDGLGYGMGITAPTWEVRRGDVAVKKKAGMWSSIYNKFIETGEKRGTEEDQILFEGNALQNIDPYFYLPDPNVAAHDIQKGEYCGWVSRDNRVNLLRGELGGKGDLFNVKYLKHIQAKESQFAVDEHKREKKFGGPTRIRDEKVVHPIDVVYMYVDLLPEEWKIKNKNRPEKWLFGLANDSVVIKAKPLGLNHNMFPVAVCAPDFDGYSSTPLSRLEVLHGLQGVGDWLFNSHIANVRKAINDMLVVDPYLVNIKDIEDPKPGKLIRMRRPAWGRGVEKAVQQLVVQDITRANMADTQFIAQWMQKVAGADDPMMGALRRGGPERLTGREFQGTRVGAVSRLERIARVIGWQAMQDIGYMFAVHAQQMMEKATFVKATGRWQQDLIAEYGDGIKRNRIKVSPLDIVVDYDVMVRDGSVPGGNFSELWLQMFKILTAVPELNQKFDIVRIFKHIARNLGAKNVNDFVRVVPDETAMREVEKGNLRPIGAA